MSRNRRSAAATFATGTIAACTMLFPRVWIAAFVLDPRVGLRLVPYILPPFTVGAIVVILWLLKQPTVSEEDTQPVNPLQVWPALQMAATFQVVLFVVAIVRGSLGEGGLLATGAILGLTDVDALTISMAKSAAAGISPETAAQAIAIGITANCVMKAAIAVVVGTHEFSRRSASALGAMAVVLVLTLVR
jgi:uncharacterized membrane protein (DUF4010 family)